MSTSSVKLIGNSTLLDKNLLLNNINPFDIRNKDELIDNKILDDKTINGKIYFFSKNYFREPNQEEFKTIEAISDIINNMKLSDDIPFETFDVNLNISYIPEIINEDESVTPSSQNLSIVTNSFIPNFDYNTTSDDYNDYFIIVELTQQGFLKTYNDINIQQNLWLVPSSYCGKFDPNNGPDLTKFIESTFYKYVSLDGTNLVTKKKKYFNNINPLSNEGLYVNRNIVDPNLTFENVGTMNIGKSSFLYSFAFDKYVYFIQHMDQDSTGLTLQQTFNHQAVKVFKCEKIIVEDTEAPDYGKEILSPLEHIYTIQNPYSMTCLNYVTIGNKVYFVNGQKLIYEESVLIDRDTVNQIYCLEIEDDINSVNYGKIKNFYDTKCNLPKACSEGHMFIINSRLYYGGGYVITNNTITNNQDLFFIDINNNGSLSSNGWGIIPNQLTSYSCSMIQTKSKIYIIGPRDTNISDDLYFTNYTNNPNVIIDPNIDIKLSSFAKAPVTLPESAKYFRMNFVTDKFAFIFGYHGIAYKDEILYAPIDENGTLGSFQKLQHNITGLQSSGIIPTKDYLYIMGGFSKPDSNFIISNSIYRAELPSINLTQTIDKYNHNIVEISEPEKALDTKSKIDIFDDGSSKLLLNFNNETINVNNKDSILTNIGNHYSEGKYNFGSSRQFYGSEYIKLNQNLNPNGFTVSLNFMMNQFPTTSNRYTLLSSRTNPTSLDGISLSCDHIGKLNIYTRDALISATVINHVENDVLNLNVWYNIIMVHDINESKIYLNNVLYKTYIWNIPFASFPSNITIGREAETTTHNLIGYLDQYRYIDKPVSQQEREILFKESKVMDLRVKEANFSQMRIRSYDELSSECGYIATPNKLYYYGWRLNDTNITDFNNEVYVSDILPDGTIGPRKFLFNHNLGFTPGATYVYENYIYMFGGFKQTDQNTIISYKQIYRCKVNSDNSIDHNWELIGNLPVEAQSAILVGNKKDPSIIYLKIGISNGTYNHSNIVYKINSDGSLNILNNVNFNNSAVSKILYIEDNNGDFLLQLGDRDNINNPIVENNNIIKIPLVNDIPDFTNTEIIGNFTGSIEYGLSNNQIGYFEDLNNIYIIGGQKINKTTKAILSNGSKQIIKLNKNSIINSSNVLPYDGEVMNEELPLLLLPTFRGLNNGNYALETDFGWYLVGCNILDSYGLNSSSATTKIIEIPKKFADNTPKDHNITLNTFNLKKDFNNILKPNKYNNKLDEENVSKLLTFDTPTVNQKLTNLTLNGIEINNSFKPLLLSEENKIFIDWIMELIRIDGLEKFKEFLPNVNKYDFNSNYYIVIPEIIINILRTKDLIEFNTTILSDYIIPTSSTFDTDSIRKNLKDVCRNTLKSYNGIYDANKSLAQNFNENNFEIEKKLSNEINYIMILNSNHLLSSSFYRRTKKLMDKNNIVISNSYIGDFDIFGYSTDIDSNIYFISPDGDDNNDGKTINTAYLTSQNIPTDSIVILLNGIYDQAYISLDGYVSYNQVFFGCEGKTLSYYGVDKDNVKLIINRTDALASSIISGGSNVKINNLTVNYNSILGGARPDNVALAYYSGGIIFNNIKINISSYDYYSLSYHPGSPNYAYYYNCTINGGSYLVGVPSGTTVNTGRRINSLSESYNYFDTPYYEPEINKHLDLLTYNDITNYSNKVEPAYTLIPLSTDTNIDDKLVFDNLNRLTILKNININY